MDTNDKHFVESDKIRGDQGFKDDSVRDTIDSAGSGTLLGDGKIDQTGAAANNVELV